MPSLAELDQKYPSQTHKLDKFKQCFERVKHLVGDLAEFGVYNGNGSRELSTLDPNRLVWAFDTFTGMPEEDYHVLEDWGNPPGKWRPAGSPAELFEGIRNIQPVVGRFAVTLPTVPSSIRFVMCHIDCDWYESYMQVFRFLESRLQPGAILILDDIGCTGADRAIKEWKASHPNVTGNGDELIWNAQITP